jgi:hypothetical protein
MSGSGRPYDRADSKRRRVVIECQHCGAAAPDSRTFCPSCRKRLQPAVAGDRATGADRPADPAVAPTEAAAPAGAPYEQQPGTPWSYPAPRSPVHSSSIRLMSRLVIVALALVSIANVWQVVVELHRASLLSGFIHDPTSVTIDQAKAADDHVTAAAVAWLLAFLVAGGLFITWTYQVVSAVADRRPQDIRHAKGWAIGGWFVPILNWFRPKQMVDDAWRGSRPNPGDVPTVAPIVHWWWGLFLATSLLGTIASRWPTDTAHNDVVHDRIGAVANCVDIVAAIVAVLFVLHLTRRVYDDRWQQTAHGDAGPYDVR